MTYELFYAIETEVRQHLRVSEAKRVKDKQGLLQAVLNNPNVLFQWCLLSSDHQDDVIHELLKIMADLYIIIRGYSFATSCIEIYKQSMHKESGHRNVAKYRKVALINCVGCRVCACVMQFCGVLLAVWWTCQVSAKLFSIIILNNEC